MKNLGNILNHQEDPGNRRNINIFLFLLISYITGIISWYATENPYLLILGLIIPPFILFFKKQAVIIFLSSLLFFSLGNLRASYQTLKYSGEAKGEGRIITFPKNSDYYSEAKIDIKKSNPIMDTYNTIRFNKNIVLKPLDYLYFTGSVKKRIYYRNDNDYPNFYQNFLSNRYFIKAEYVKKISENTLIENLSKFRNCLKNNFLNLKGEEKFFFIEILFGEKVVEQKIREIFNKSGTGHILSISGLHFSIIVLFSYFLVYLITYFFPEILLKIPRALLTIFLALPFSLIYAFLSWLSIPSMRAFTIFIIISFFIILKKNPNYLSLLSIIAILFLIFDPTYLFLPSFQLSFTSVFALIMFDNKKNHSFIYKFKNKIVKYFLGILLASLYINIFIFPIISNLQDKCSLLSILISNIFVIPIFTFFILPILFLSLPISFLEEKIFSTFLLIPTFGYKIILFLMDQINTFFDPLSLKTHFNFYESLLYYLSLISFLYLPKFSKIIPIFLFIIMIIFTNLASPKERNFSAIFLDVGQGESSIIKSKNGKIIMIDCGGNIYDDNIYKRAYAPFFRKHNINEIYALIISHHHPDHTIALNDIKNYIKIKNIFLTEESYLNLKESLKSLNIIIVKDYRNFSIDNLDITLYPPSFKDTKINNNSLWAVINTDDKTFLFTGDTENKYIDLMIKKLKLKPNKEVYLKVPHHGSKSSLNYQLYKMINPHFAIISVGSDNIWNLPSKEVLNFLMLNKIKILRTDLSGQITIQ